MSNMKFEGWTLKVTKGLNGDQVECRKTFSHVGTTRGNTYNIFGQALLIVSLKGWKWNTETGTLDVRLSMNGPCPMNFDDLAGLERVAEHARMVLVNRNLKTSTLIEVKAAISGCYPHLSDYAWPVMLGQAGTIEGVEQFIVYPKEAFAIAQMNELFEGVGNVEVIQKEMGPIVAAPAL